MTRYRVEPAAESDLREIADYVAQDSPIAAHRLIETLYGAFGLLADQPGLGHTREDITPLDVLFWTVRGRHTIVYRKRHDGIDVLRVLGAGRDVSALLGG